MQTVPKKGSDQFVLTEKKAQGHISQARGVLVLTEKKAQGHISQARGVAASSVFLPRRSVSASCVRVETKTDGGLISQARGVAASSVFVPRRSVSASCVGVETKTDGGHLSTGARFHHTPVAFARDPPARFFLFF